MNMRIEADDHVFFIKYDSSAKTVTINRISFFFVHMTPVI